MKMTRERNAWIGLVLLLAACIFLFHQEQSGYEEWAVQEHSITSSILYADQDLDHWQPDETSAVPSSVESLSPPHEHAAYPSEPAATL